MNQGQVTDWIRNAMEGLFPFFDGEHACFIRDSLREDNPGPEVPDAPSPRFPAFTGATTSNRAFAACTEFLYFAGEQTLTGPDWLPIIDQATKIARRMINDYYTTDLDQLRAHSQNGVNMFTDSHILLSLAAVSSPFLDEYIDTDDTRARVRRAADTMATDLHQRLNEYGGGRVDEIQDNSEIVTLSVLRALESARSAEAWTSIPVESNAFSASIRSSLRQSARADVLRQLGLHSARDPEFDPGSLVAGLAILHRFAYRSSRRLVMRGLAVLTEAQAADGSWRADVLTLGHRRLVYLSSIEMGNIIASIAIAELARGTSDIAVAVLPSLYSCFSLLEAGYTDSTRRQPQQADVYSGWANDRTRQAGVVESWSTAITAQFLLRMFRLQQLVDQADILCHYRVNRFPEGPSLRWSDLTGWILPPSSLFRSGDGMPRLEAMTPALDKASDPAGGAIRRGLRQDLIAPILGTAMRKPRGCASFLLFGPPGTRKTSLVRAVAEALGWPLVTLSPPDFLVNGIEGLEKRAEEIFNELLRLRRVVVLFDECEEFFRRRLPVETPEHRTQGAFITAGMLPRLQDLRQKAWIVFAVVTNTELDEIDPAVVRRGRLDRKQRVGFPLLAGQQSYVVRLLAARDIDVSPEKRSVIEGALREYDQRLDQPEYWGIARAALKGERLKAVRERQTSGDLKGYFVRMNQLRSMEAELPLVTFDALEQLVDRITDDTGILGDQSRLTEDLAELCSGGEPVTWADV